MKLEFRDPVQLFIGALLLGLGVGFLLDSLGLVNFGNLLGSWWPLIIILFGFAHLISRSQSFLFSGFFIIAGILLLVDQLDVINLNFWSVFWPLLLVLIGFLVLFRSGGSKLSSEKSVNMVAIFSGDERNLDTEKFEGGNITAIFGGVKLDLRKATFKEGATINVFAAFGGVDVILPENARAVVSGFPLFGGFEDKTVKPKKFEGTLIIKGTVLFGGVSVKN
jgi:predicted membrane protein